MLLQIGDQRFVFGIRDQLVHIFAENAEGMASAFCSILGRGGCGIVNDHVHCV